VKQRQQAPMRRFTPRAASPAIGNYRSELPLTDAPGTPQKTVIWPVI
jgi:hypothetical protein